MNDENPKKTQILEAACDEFQRKGFQSCSMDEISRLADVSKRTVYNYFDSKEALFLSVACYAQEKMHEVLISDFDATRDTREQLFSIALTKIQMLQSEDVQRFSRMLLAEIINNPKMAQLLENSTHSFEPRFAEWLAEAVKHKQLQIDDIETALMQFFSVIKGMVFWPALIHRKTFSDSEMHSVAQSTVDLFMSRYSSGDC